MYSKTTLSTIFKKSPSIEPFEHIWIPELKKEGFCTGYYWYEDEQNLIYAIALNKCYSRHYLTKEDFKLTGFYHDYLRANCKSLFEIFQIVRVRETQEVTPICGIEWMKPYGWHYHLDNGKHSPYCEDELEVLAVN